MTRRDRGVAGMLDFLTAVVVVVGAIASTSRPPRRSSTPSRAGPARPSR
ncbi:hypothetical protein GJ629_15460 [Halapricum sp. CBA1109]|nr:hypothetical protein [Halapricum sp. CBA1109]MUV91114.1 hypothetical protein [Halapricum sp. CBA1109]